MSELARQRRRVSGAKRERPCKADGVGSFLGRATVAALLAGACAPSAHDENAPVDCDAAIVPLLELEVDDWYDIDGVRSGDASALVIRTDEEHGGGARPQRLVVIDRCGTDARTLIDDATDIYTPGDGPTAPWGAWFEPGAPGESGENWICDPFGGRPTQRMPEGMIWQGAVDRGGRLLVSRGDEQFAVTYDDRGLGEPQPLTAEPEECGLVVEGVRYGMTDAHQLVAYDLATGTSSVVFDHVDGCSHERSGEVLMLFRGTGDRQRGWAFEPATGRTIELPKAARNDLDYLILAPQLRLFWFERAWAGQGTGIAFDTAPDGTALLVANGDIFRVSPHETSLLWIGDGIGTHSLVSVEFDDGFFYINEQPDPPGASKIYRLEDDGTGFTDIFGKLVREPLALTQDRWAFTDDGGLYLREVVAQRDRLIWPWLSGPILPLSRSLDGRRDDLLFGGADEHGRNKTIYLARPDLLE